MSFSSISITYHRKSNLRIWEPDFLSSDPRPWVWWCHPYDRQSHQGDHLTMMTMVMMIVRDLQGRWQEWRWWSPSSCEALDWKQPTPKEKNVYFFALFKFTMQLTNRINFIWLNFIIVHVMNLIQFSVPYVS